MVLFVTFGERACVKNSEGMWKCLAVGHYET